MKRYCINKHNGWNWSSAAIAANNNSKRLTDMPKFYGNANSSRGVSKPPQSEPGTTPWNAQSSVTCCIQKPMGSCQQPWRKPRQPLTIGRVIRSYSYRSLTLREQPSSTASHFRIWNKDRWRRCETSGQRFRFTERIKDTIDPAHIKTLEQQAFPAADWDDVIKECRQAKAAVQDFYIKMLFFARLYREVWLKVMEAAPVLTMDSWTSM